MPFSYPSIKKAIPVGRDLMPIPTAATDRNQTMMMRRRAGSPYREIAIAFGVSSARVRQIVEREEKRDERARELELAATLSQQPNPYHLQPRLRAALSSLLGKSDFTPEDVQARQLLPGELFRLPHIGLAEWQELKEWMAHAGLAI